jgi:hypothetical protein
MSLQDGYEQRQLDQMAHQDQLRPGQLIDGTVDVNSIVQGNNNPLLDIWPNGQIDTTTGYLTVVNYRQAGTNAAPIADAQLVDSADQYDANFRVALTVDVGAEGTGSTAGKIDFFLNFGNGSAGINGYMFEIDYTSGDYAGTIYRVDNGVLTDMSTQLQATNAAQLDGWKNITIQYKGNGNLDLHVAGLLQATAKDTTYAGEFYLSYAAYGAEGFIRHAAILERGGTPMADPIDFVGTITHKRDVLLTWQYPTALPHDFSHFEVRSGPTWSSATLVDKTKQFKLLITDPPPGSNTYWVAAVNTSDDYDPNPPSVTVTVSALPDVTNLTGTITHKQDVLLTWTKPSPLPTGFASFEIRSGGTSWATATLVDRTKAARYLITDPPAGSVTYWVGVEDRAGNYDPTPPSVTVTVSALPDVTNLTGTLTHKSDVLLTWTAPSPLPTGFAEFEIRTASTNVGWASAAYFHSTKQHKLLITDPAPGTTYYWVGVKDRAGNYDPTPPSVSVTVSALPDVTNLTATVTKKADILLTWTLTPLPTGFAEFEIRSASTNVGWASATYLHSTKQHKLLITDPPTGTVYYWVGVKDRAGNYDSNPPSVSGSISAGFTLDTVPDGTTYARLKATALSAGDIAAGYITTARLAANAVSSTTISDTTVPVAFGPPTVTAWTPATSIPLGYFINALLGLLYESSTNNASSTSITSSTLTATASNQLALTFFGFSAGGAQSASTASGLTSSFNQSSSTTIDGLTGQYKITTASGTQGPWTSTIGTAMQNWTLSLLINNNGSALSVGTGTNATSTTSSLTINKPASVVAGTLMVACIDLNGQPITVIPSGWFEIGASLGGHLIAFAKVATASEPASYTWTYSKISPTGGIAPTTGGIVPITNANTNTTGQLCTVAGTSAGTSTSTSNNGATPAWSTTPQATVTDNSVTWECIGTYTSYNTEVQLNSATITVNSSSDTVQVVFKPAVAASSVEPGDQSEYKIYNGATALETIDALISAQNNFQSSGEGASQYVHYFTGLSGSVTLAVKLTLINGSGSNTFAGVIPASHMAVTDMKR